MIPILTDWMRTNANWFVAAASLARAIVCSIRTRLKSFVAKVIAKQAATLNTHTRYLHETILDYSEALIAKMPREIDRITYQCTGSEANDLAIRIARNYTSGRGIIITNEAYRGNTEKKPDEPGDPWFNFHAGRNDFKLRYALQGTRYWGSYITDAINQFR